MTQTALAPTRGDNVRAIVKRILCFALFVAALIATFRTAWIVSTTLLDSDASSSLLLGEKLSREGGILSTTFIYATELYVVDVQIIYSLLFRICSDWSLVRFWGAVIMQVLMIAAYGYLAKQARMSLNMFFVSAAALLLPFSVPYGRIVLYHNFYMPHVTLGFLTVGLYMGVASEKAAGRVWWKNAIRGGLLCLVAFLWGLSGVRPLMICAAPLAVAAVLTGVLGEKRENRIRPECGALLWAAAMVAAMAAGYLVNANVLSNIYDFRRYDSQTLILASPEKREQIFRGFLAAGGYQDDIELFEPHGFLAVTSAADEGPGRPVPEPVLSDDGADYHLRVPLPGQSGIPLSALLPARHRLDHAGPGQGGRPSPAGGGKAEPGKLEGAGAGAEEPEAVPLPADGAGRLRDAAVRRSVLYRFLPPSGNL